MKTTLGMDGLAKSWQAAFAETETCCHCGGEARVALVAHEGLDEDDRAVWPRDHVQFVCDMRDNGGVGDFWPHDCVAVAVYLCRQCAQATAVYNQA